MDLKLRVTPAVLIPRPETEELVQRIAKDYVGAEDGHQRAGAKAVGLFADGSQRFRIESGLPHIRILKPRPALRTHGVRRGRRRWAPGRRAGDDRQNEWEKVTDPL